MSRPDLVEKFQCPGCVSGSDPKCGSYKPSTYGHGCEGHVVGTFVLGGDSFALGMPKGFNKCRRPWGPNQPRDNSLNIRIWSEGEAPTWDNKNVPVWAMEQDGFLFVRTLSPRIGVLAVDVIEGGTLALVPTAIDVGEFIDEID